MGTVTRIALTGGPCGGKSTSISVIEQQLTSKGYQVFVVEEMATNVINSGAHPGAIGLFEFQKAISKLQLERNKVYDSIANKISEEKGKDVVIIYDRGIPDCKGYVTDEEYLGILKYIGVTETGIMDYYDGVFHLVTAADGAVEAYTCSNNTARTETPKQAIEKDRSCLRAWTGHSHLRVITNNGCTFEEKIDKLLDEVYSLLGVPIPVETERKYLIEMPDFEDLNNRYGGTTVDIIQTYLLSNGGVERRVRQRGVNGNYTFYYTEKRKITGISRSEIEKKISYQEYLRLLMETDTTKHPIRKCRTCFVCNGNYFELDIYPFWSDKAILEVELTNESKSVDLPGGITLIKEVTDDDNYKNSSLAINLGNIE